MPPADTAALICLSFTNACVVSTIITLRCGRMAPPHSKRLGLKHVILVHFRNELNVYTMIQVIHNNNAYECDCEYEYSYLQRTIDYCRHKTFVPPADAQLWCVFRPRFALSKEGLRGEVPVLAV